MIGCEFCTEFQTDDKQARFRQLYQEIVSSRIVLQTEHFVAVPTIGQLFEGSLLILPKEHIETCASLNVDVREEMFDLLNEAMVRCKPFGIPIFFEHGATSATGGSCGIYHAHLHVIPLPKEVDIKLLFPESVCSKANLLETLKALSESRHYLLFGNEDMVLSRDLEASPGNFPSQFFRRRLTDYFCLDKSWDWRMYSHVEPALIKTLALAS